MLERTILVVVAVFLGGLLLEVSIRREVLPFVIFWRSWMLSVRQALEDPVNVLAVFGLFAVGWLMQDYLAGHSEADGTGLVVGSAVWQAAMSLLLAISAARFHLRIVAGVFADAGLKRMKLPHLRQIAAKVALVGGAIWLVTYAITVLSNLLVLHSPAAFISASAVAMALIAQVLLAPFALIRPAIACGAKRPVENGLRLALRKMPLLLTLVVLLALPPFLLQFALGLLQSVSDWAETSRILAAACLVTFGVLQFFAIEAATLIVLREAVLPKIGQR